MEFMMSNLKIAHTVFGISVAALGIQHFILDNVIGTKPPPTTFLDSSFLVVGLLYKIGLITLAIAILFNYKIKSAAFSLGLLIFVWTLFRHFPLVIVNITDPGELNSMFMAVAVSGSSFIIGSSIQHGALSFPTYLIVNRCVVKMIGNFFYGTAIVVFGVQHVLYASFIASLIPTWIPRGDFWSYGTGLALIAAGISITFEWKSKSSSLWLGIMISLWIVLVHFPRVRINPGDHYEWTSLFQASIIATSAFVLQNNLSAPSRNKEAIRHKELARPSKVRKYWHKRNPAVKEPEM
jgi:uncharacterized membrane protein